MSRGMLCLTTPTHKQKLLRFGIMQAWYYLLFPSFLPSCLCFLSPWKPPHRRFFLDSPSWDITCLVMSLGSSETPDWHHSLCAVQVYKPPQSRSYKLPERWCLLLQQGLVLCSSRKNQMQHTSALHSRFKKSKEKITPIHLKLHQVFQVRSSTVDEGHRQISHRPLSQHICLSVPFTSKE